MLALRYGVAVPQGYTFVRPHERGKKNRDIIYRSRSALQSLYRTEATQDLLTPHWFRFEKDVHRLMDALGFDVEHIAASGRHDQGVDVYATKGTDFDAVHWVIQCKCWSQKRKIYPGTVRELVGVLNNYLPGTRGMLVTTSSFSTGARTEATRHNVRLVDGEEFMKLTAASDAGAAKT